MKVLSLDTYFLLPDDFNGDVNDAIEELLKYRRGKKLTKFVRNKEPSKTWEEMTQLEKWNYFCESTKKGFKHVGSASCSDLDNEWNEI